MEFKNVLLTLFIVISTGLSINAQSKFGIKVGITTFNYDQEQTFFSPDYNAITHNIDFMGYSNGQSIGLFKKNQIGFLFLQTELLYTSYRTMYDVKSYIDDNIGDQSVTEEVDNVDINIIAGINKGHFSFGVGPALHKTVDFKSELSMLAFYEEKRASNNLGFQGLVGFNYGPLQLDLKYETLFNKVADHVYYNGNHSGFKSSLSSFSMQIGLAF